MHGSSTEGRHYRWAGAAAGPRNLHVSTRRYVTQMPRVVLTDFVTDREDPAAAGQAGLPAGRRRTWRPLGVARGLRLDAVPGPARRVAGVRREPGHQEPRRDGVPDQGRRARAVRGRPDRAGGRRVCGRRGCARLIAEAGRQHRRGSRAHGIGCQWRQRTRLGIDAVRRQPARCRAGGEKETAAGVEP